MSRCCHPDCSNEKYQALENHISVICFNSAKEVVKVFKGLTATEFEKRHIYIHFVDCSESLTGILI